MSFCLHDIKGAVVEKKEYPNLMVYTANAIDFMKGWNSAIDAQSSVRLRLNRNNILDSIRLIGSTYHPILIINGKIYHFMCKEDIADAIIGAEKEIVEVDQ